ncbi:plastid division protein PDV2-like isoform X1 [Durio zibethinus]|uniref:Plastid division protein PDV2-like isoform X1 n=1 Tax=Durio zibethinus TaxID=66656 RepID=A0A6P5X9M8_DURZI|nr:plastid division protein PDV2-like isoform X1 [Durio zibethinus]
MEEERVGLALAKATELRLKISNCIQKAAAGKPSSPKEQSPQKQDEEQTDKLGSFNGDKVPNFHQSLTEAVEEQEEEETERLLNIRDALESLESQLFALQKYAKLMGKLKENCPWDPNFKFQFNLQHQQRYEKEVALAKIDYSRRILLQKLEEYQGKDLEVILEAAAFVSETVENNNDLPLPPYPSHPPRSLVLDNGYLSHLQSTYKSLTNGLTPGDPTNDPTIMNGHQENKKQYKSRNLRQGLGHFISSAVKTVLPLVGVIYILSLSNFVPNLGKGTPLKFLAMVQQRATEEKNSTVQCPPGKVLVMEGGEARCLVKERIEVPFESIVAKPDINYGCG